MMFPTPFLARSTIYRGAIKHMAMAKKVVSSGGKQITDIGFVVSPDGRHWFKIAAGGDLARYTQSGSADVGAFYPERMARLGSRVIVVGALLDAASQARGAIFWTDDGRTWSHAPMSIDGAYLSSGNRSFVDIAVGNGVAVALLNTGEIAVSTDGENWATRSNIGFTGTSPARTIAFGDGTFIAAGTAGQLFSTTDPLGVWTPRTSEFGAAAAIEHAHFGAGLFVIMGTGGRISSSPTAVTWTPRTPVLDGSVNWLDYGGGVWFASASPLGFIKSSSGTAWANAAAKPTKTVFSGFFDSGLWVTFSSSQVSLSNDNGVAWENVEQPNLLDAVYSATI